MEDNTIKILAIDDNQDNLITIKALINDAFQHVSVHTCLSGLEGIALAAVVDPDVILLDILMPGMDGFDVCQRLKADPNLKEIPVIFVTAIKDDKQTRIRALEVGAEAFLAKPIDESELTAQIRAMLKIKNLNARKRDENSRLAALVAEQTHELKEIHKATLNLLEDLRQENEARRKTEEALRQSEALYRSIINASPDNIVITDADARILMLSPRLLTHYGISSDNDLIGRSVFDFIDKEDKMRVMHDFSLAQKGLNAGTNEYRTVILPNGKVVDLEVNVGTILNIEGNIDKFVFVARDISERKIAQSALHESERKYRLITEKISDVVWLMDLTGKNVFVSPSIESFTGYTVDEYMCQSIKDRFTAESAKKALQMLKDEIDVYHSGNFEINGYRKVVQLNYRCKDGSIKTGELRMAPYFDDKKTLIGMHGVTRDITEAKRTEEALKASEALYRSVLTASPDGIEVTDLNGTILMTSPVTHKLTGYANDMDIIGHNMLDFLSPLDVERARLDIGGIRRGECKGPEEYRLRRADGEFVDVEINAEYVRNDDNMPTGMVVIIRDITERKIADEKIRHIARLYALLGQINQAIVRIHDADELFSQICTIAVEYGQFRMAWLGIVDYENNSVIPHVWDGYEDGYLNFLEGILTTDGIGPTSLALESGSIICCNDIATDQTMIHSRDEALKRGYHSLVVIPIRRHGKIFAILSLYASEAGFFSEEEQKLLTDIGEDIYFALDAIDSEKNRNQTEMALKQSRAELKAIYDNAPVMMCLVNKKREVLFANPAFNNFTNLPLSLGEDVATDDFLVGGLLHCINAADITTGCGTSTNCRNCNLRKAVIETFETGEGQTNVEYHSLKRGFNGESQEVFLLVSTALIQTDNEPNLLLCLSDITDRKLAEEALQKSEMLLRTFIDNIPFEIWARDINTVGILENKKSIEQVGSIIGKRPGMQNTVKKEMTDMWIKDIARVMLGEIIQDEFVSLVGHKKHFFDKIIFPIKVDDKIIGIAGFNIDITDRKSSDEALRESREELKKFAVHLQNVREEERILLAREIHDELGQILVAMKIDIGMLKQSVLQQLTSESSASVVDKFDELNLLVDNTIKTARKIMTDLRSDVLELLGFEDAVKQYLRSYKERYKVACHFNSSVKNLNLTNQQGIALFRIIQEALNNTAKYAKATAVDVELKCTNNKLSLEVIDNGIGFDPKQRKRSDSYGLIGMKERVYLLEGDLNIISAPGKGTRIEVVINYDDKVQGDSM